MSLPPKSDTTSPPRLVENENEEDKTNSRNTSLHHSLLGPSLLKAGQQGVDQKKIGEIIYNASLGSKFFKHEQRRDEALTKRIEDILRRKTDLEAGNLSGERRRMDEQLALLEQSRDLSQIIVHVDCDAFYASVEELDQPELRSVPMAVGCGVLTTCNYKAREFGVRSGMAGHIAKKICPQLVFLKLNFDKYNKKAKEVREVFARYDERYEAVGCDEAFLNLTEYLKDHLDFTPETLVEKIRQEVFEHAKITVSAGIGPNAKIAKIASNKNKPNGQFRIPNDRASVMSFMDTLAVRQINGVGRVFERELRAIGITTCGDIYPHRALLRELFGEKASFFLLNCYLGLGRTDIRPIEEYERKSIGTESTFRDIFGPEKLREKLRYTAEELEKDLEKLKLSGRTLVLKVKLHTYQVLSRQRVLRRLPRTADELYSLALPLLSALEADFGGGEKFKIRLMGLRVTQLASTEKLKNSIDVKEWFFGQSAPKPQDTVGSAKLDDDGWEIWPDEEFERAQAVEEEEELKLTQELAEHLEETEDRRSDAAQKETPQQEMWDCPICGRAQSADDYMFNQHVDFCLSKQAIREAVQETSKVQETAKVQVPSERNVKRFWGGLDPPAEKRRKAT